MRNENQNSSSVSTESKATRDLNPARLVAAAPALYDAAQVAISILTDKDGDPRDALIFLQQAVALVVTERTRN